MPERIGRLPELVQNLWWTWQPTARDLLRRLDFPLWRMTRHNGVEMLRRVDPERLEEVAHDPLFLRLYDATIAELDAVTSGGHGWFAREHPEHAGGLLAYFCAEFGVHTSLPIYSGGLGILAGDHLKEAGDLGLPMVGCGLLYQKGYFRQRIDPEGRQVAVDEPFEAASTPLEALPGAEGEPWLATVHPAGRAVRIRAWRLRLGRSSIYLLDTELDANDPADRALTQQLYGGDLEMRLRQEIVLGIGGVRALRALDLAPDVWHANEGHAAFLLLERMRELVEDGLPFEEARRRVAETTVFTTHTPVAAGHDAFPRELVDRYFEGYWAELGLDRDGFHELGRHPEDDGRFHMSVLALRCSEHRNAVSRRHGEVSRRMWRGLWPGRQPEDVPIGHVTNGVHFPTWVAPEFKALFARYLGPDWRLRHDDAGLWEAALDLPHEAVWRAHEACKRRLLAVVRERARDRWMEPEADPRQVVASGTLLDPDALTLGFARRFATYKRADLIFSDLDRLKRILLDPWHPVQIVFAGKAHPADAAGQELLARVYRAATDPELGGRVAFLEDYEMHVAHHVVAGVDLWLNNPVPPQEASGTSGQKAAINGVPQLSTLDGWWVEGYTRLNGWAIDEGRDGGAPGPGSAAEGPRGDGREGARGARPPLGGTAAAREAPPASEGGAAPEDRSELDARAIYALLEEEIVPLFYRRDADEIPRGWVRMMQQAIRTAGASFSARRMLKDYVESYYRPALEAADRRRATARESSAAV